MNSLNRLKSNLLLLVMLFCLWSVYGCKKCYTCTKKCGTCTKAGMPTLAGCDGDSHVLPGTVDAWNALLVSQGYTCEYDNVVEPNVCSEAAKSDYEDIYYNCISK